MQLASPAAVMHAWALHRLADVDLRTGCSMASIGQPWAAFGARSGPGGVPPSQTLGCPLLHLGISLRTANEEQKRLPVT